MERWVFFSSLPEHTKIGRMGTIFFSTSAYYKRRLERWVFFSSLSEHTIQEDCKGGYSFLLYQCILYRKFGKDDILLFSTSSAYYTGRLERWIFCPLYQSILYCKDLKGGYFFLLNHSIICIKVDSKGKNTLIATSTKLYSRKVGIKRSILHACAGMYTLLYREFWVVYSSRVY